MKAIFYGFETYLTNYSLHAMVSVEGRIYRVLLALPAESPITEAVILKAMRVELDRIMTFEAPLVPFRDKYLGKVIEIPDAELLK